MKNTYISNTYKLLYTTLFTGFVLMFLAISGCKKQELFEGSPSSIKVFNGINGAVNLYGNYNGDRPTNFRSAISIQSRRASINSNFSDEIVNGSYFAIPDTMAKDQPVFKKDFDLTSSRVNTLFLMGDKSNVDFLFVPLNFKRYTAGDSLIYLTFVNISNDLPVSVNIKGQPNGSLLNPLAYKNVSEIINIPAGNANSRYDIEFRDAATGNLLTTFIIDNSNPAIGYYNTYLYKNTSLVLVGKRGQTGTDKMEVIRVSHD